MVKAHLRCVLAAKLHILLRGFCPADWRRCGLACVDTLLEPVVLGWPVRWIADLSCSVSYSQNRPGTRLCRLFGLWLRHNSALVKRAVERQYRYGPDQGMGALFDHLSDVMADLRVAAV